MLVMIMKMTKLVFLVSLPKTNININGLYRNVKRINRINNY